MRYRAEVVAELAPAGLGSAVELAVVAWLRKNGGDRLEPDDMLYAWEQAGLG